MHEASVQLFEEYRQKYDGSVDRALAETQPEHLIGLSYTDIEYSGISLYSFFSLYETQKC